ncbi:hypothetical protein FOL46_006319 [Perkinsus olseni]|uniref:Uncharacterized protein n=1 Tax=Perkinsus olseni TaxID=32597 RepID=A0A7J6LLJ0_PEROL|nr:hypothetical protein FOL46_006319 [Perkinsus olseni]
MVLHEYLRHFADLPGDLLPLKESGVGNALRCWGQGDAMENANSDIQDALHRAEDAADATFLVKPALKSSRLLVVHNDAVARGVAHIKQAMKALSPYVPQPDQAKNHITVVSEGNLTVCTLATRMRTSNDHGEATIDDVHAFLWG